MPQEPKAEKAEKTETIAAKERTTEGGVNPSAYIGVEVVIDMGVPEAIIKFAEGGTVGPIPYPPGTTAQEISDDVNRRLKGAAERASNGLANVTIKPLSSGSDLIQ
jgi:hypothetical protein